MKGRFIAMSRATQMDSDSQTETQGSKRPGGAWADRLAALKNIPPVLHFVWESGPHIVFWNISIRILVAFLPVGIGIIGRFIIDGVNRIVQHQPLPQHFWWLVIAEMALAVLTGALSRAVDYFDNLLADRYTHHVSVEVMRSFISVARTERSSRTSATRAPPASRIAAPST